MRDHKYNGVTLSTMSQTDLKDLEGTVPEEILLQYLEEPQTPIVTLSDALDRLGVTSKAARILADKFITVDELLSAARSGELAKLKGIGKATVQTLSQ